MIENGSRVKFHFTLHVDDELADSSRDGDPVEYVHGQGQLIPGLEAGLAGMSAGETRTVELPPDRAYGEYDPDIVNRYPKEAFDDLEDLAQGDLIRGTTGGKPFMARIAEIGEEHVSLDMNHPLAGRTLRFDLEVVSVS